MESPIYVIVRFELNEGEFEVLFPLIQQFFKREVSTFPGFISARIHTNEERSVLINYATWESPERFQKFITELAMVSDISKQIQKFPAKTDRVFEVTL